MHILLAKKNKQISYAQVQMSFVGKGNGKFGVSKYCFVFVAVKTIVWQLSVLLFEPSEQQWVGSE